jgi:histidinol-phosphate aminotransferase
VRSPFNLSIPASAAGIASLGDRAHIAYAAEHNAEWLPKVTTAVGKLGLKVTPSVANFVLIHFPTEKGKTAADADAFLMARGIVARQVGAYGLPGALRMTIGSTEANQAAIAALGEFVKSWKKAK